MEDSFKVYLRIHAIPKYEKRSISLVSTREISITHNTRNYNFTFDKIFLESTSKCQVYKESLHKLLPRLYAGLNINFLVYCPEEQHALQGHNGLVHLALKEILTYSSIKLRYFEIEGEDIKNLLSFKRKLKEFEDDYEEIPVHNFEFAKRLIEEANFKSSKIKKVHTITQIILDKYESKLSLIQLANGEFPQNLKATDESSQKNSLQSVEYMMRALLVSNPELNQRKNSNLSALIKNIHEKNSLNALIACISPSIYSTDETLSLLKLISSTQMFKQTQFEESFESMSVLKERNNLYDFQKISEIMMQNFEEHHELKNSIHDIDKLNEDNARDLKRILTEIDTTDANSDRANKLAKKLELCNQNIQMNEEVKQELVKSLHENRKKKCNLLKEFNQEDKIVELKRSLCTIEKEKHELETENERIKKETVLTLNDNKAKDLIIKKLELEICKFKLRTQNYSTRSLSNHSSPRLSLHSLKEERFKRKLEALHTQNTYSNDLTHQLSRFKKENTLRARNSIEKRFFKSELTASCLSNTN